MKVLVVDDDPVVTETIDAVLRMDGCEVCVGGTAADCLQRARTWNPDLILLDIVMPGEMTGLDALRVMRRDSHVPVILISARGADTDKVLGLRYADDYLVKPFSMVEMLARIHAVLRRAGTGFPADSLSLIRAGDLRIDTDTWVVTLAGRTLSLTPLEYGILAVLAARPGHVFKHAELSARVWGRGEYVDRRTLHVHISALRRKLEPVPRQPRHLLTVRGVGFRYVA